MDAAYAIPLDELAVHLDAFSDHWGHGRFTPDDVLGTYPDPRPWLFAGDGSDAPDTWEYHMGRVAYLVDNRDDTPIVLEICDGVQMFDGWHRYAAATIRGDATIRVSFGGYVEEFWDTFPSATPCTG